nr:putative dual DUF1576 superfamily membrane protein [uncultured bacterium]
MKFKLTIQKLLLLLGYTFLGIGVILQSPQDLVKGLIRIITTSGVLIIDFFEVGGIGPALVNASLLMIGSIYLAEYHKAEWTGSLIAAMFLMFGFGLFGKTIVNVIPFIIGVYLYARLTKKDFAPYISNALQATSFSPIVTEIMFVLPLGSIIGVPLGMGVGLSVGLLLIPLVEHFRKTHLGFNLYNTGFTIGLLSTIYVSVMKSYGYEVYKQAIFYTNHTHEIAIILTLIFSNLLVLGLYKNSGWVHSLTSLFKETGYHNNDFYKSYGFKTTLINMALLGYISLAYVLLVGGSLNGPIIGAILTVVGFGGFGKHPLNILPIFIGVFIGSITKLWSINEPVILFAALFGTALAPISGYFGPLWGVVAAYLNSSVVLATGNLHGGLNLYNTGFSSGLVAAVLVPLLFRFLPKRKNSLSINNHKAET